MKYATPGDRRQRRIITTQLPAEMNLLPATEHPRGMHNASGAELSRTTGSAEDLSTFCDKCKRGREPTNVAVAFHVQLFQAVI